jgi:hypothetical protein
MRLSSTKDGKTVKQSHRNDTKKSNIPVTWVNNRNEKHLPIFVMPPMILVIVDLQKQDVRQSS